MSTPATADTATPISTWPLRVALILWGLFFLAVGVQGMIDPASFTETFLVGAVGGEPMGSNTLRADLGAFFIVAGAGALAGLLPGQRQWLLASAALMAVALIGRIVGVVAGEPMNFAISRAMLVEALSVALLIGAWWQFGKARAAARHDPAATPAVGTTSDPVAPPLDGSAHDQVIPGDYQR